MGKLAKDLVPGDRDQSRRLGEVIIETVRETADGEIEITYSRPDRTGYGMITCDPNVVFRVNEPLQK